MTNTDTNTDTLQGQQQPQASKQSYFGKEHKDKDKDNDNDNENENDNENDNDNDNDNDKYQYNFYNSCGSNKDICNRRYEDLRKKGMTMELKGKNTNTNISTPGSQELSIFIQRGMIDWFEVWNKCQLQLNEMTNSKKIKAFVYNENDNDRQLDTDTASDSDYAGINLPLDLQAQVKNLLVQIVMSTLPNKMSAKHIIQR